MLNIDFRPIFSSPSPTMVTPFMSLTRQKTTDNQPITDALLPVLQFFNSVMQLKKKNNVISVDIWNNDYRIKVIFHAYTCIRPFRNRNTDNAYYIISIVKGRPIWRSFHDLFEQCQENNWLLFVTLACFITHVVFLFWKVRFW